MRIDQGWLIGGVLIALALGACKGREEFESTTKSVEEIRGSLRYVGRDVTVIGKVDKVVDERAFVLEGDGIIWPRKLLVVARAPVRFGPTRLAEDEELVVSGIVRRMAPREIDGELSRSLDDELVGRYRDQAILVADSVRLVETQARWSKPFQQGAIVSAIRLLSALDPTTFAGHALDLGNVPVRAVTDRGLWVGFGDRSELFVAPLHETQLVGIEAGDRVAIRGTVRELAATAGGAGQVQLAPARTRGERVYIEASELTKLSPRPST